MRSPNSSGGVLSSAKTRNGEIEVLRLIFSIAVLLVHSQYVSNGADSSMFRGGWLGVEFFFLVSGYLMAAHEDRLPASEGSRTIGSDTFRYVWRKAKSLYPYLTFAIIIQFLGWRTFIGGNFFPPFSRADLKSFITSALNYIFPYSLCYDGYSYLGYTWYLSAMIWGMFLLYPLLRRNRDVFYCLIAPALVVFGLGFYSWRYSSLVMVSLEDYLFSAGLIRGMAEMSLGCLCYVACKRLQTISLTKVGACIFSGIELFSLLAVVYRMVFIRNDGILDFIMLALIAVVVIAAFSGKGILTFEMKGKWADFLGKFSLALYINSCCWSFLTARAWPDMDYWTATAIYIGLAVTAAVSCMAVCAAVGKWWHIYKNRIYAILIADGGKGEAE